MASILCQINDSWLELLFYNNYWQSHKSHIRNEFFFIQILLTPHSVPSISPQKSHAVTRMHLLLLFHNFSYLLFSMLLQAFGWFWCKKYRVSINETGGGRRIVLWANRIRVRKTCRNYYTFLYLLLLSKSKPGFLRFLFWKFHLKNQLFYCWFFSILKPKYYIQNLPLSETNFPIVHWGKTLISTLLADVFHT